jgi:hypothetical protein
MRGYRFAAIATCVGIALFSEGCGEAPPPIVPAQGIVSLNGAPVPKAQVRFIPNIGFGAEYIATGVTDEEGRFTLQCNGQPGACAVESTIVVTEADIPAHLQGENSQRELAVYLRALKNRPIPQHYASPVSSPLRVTVTAEQPDHKRELKR